MSLLIRDLVLFLLLALGVILLSNKLALPYTVGLVIVGMGLGALHMFSEAALTPELVLFVFLPPLLFEGAWSVNLSLLRQNWRVIFFLAGPGLLLSLVIIAGILHIVEHLDWLTALLLAAILSPTDPVAVLGLFRQLRVNKCLSTIIEGESLFNDGVAGSLYQIFLMLLLLSLHGQPLFFDTTWRLVLVVLWDAVGGILLGVVGGWLISQGLKRLDDPLLETTVTLITAYGLYWLAETVQTSAIVTVIVSGLLLGTYGRKVAMSERTNSEVETFWRMVAFLANALIFLLIGIQVQGLIPHLFSEPSFSLWGVALLAVGVVLLARLALVLLLSGRFFVRFTRPASNETQAELLRRPLPRSWGVILFWSGLRGALSLALVLALPTDLPNRPTLVISTYAVVAFTLLVQGLSLRWVLHRVLAKQTGRQPASRIPADLEETALIEDRSLP
ncbi:MAG TPA: cation:proton antiporter [Ktedonobacteraceae bacterium]|nr:cation:proton antiporter [Ktedonobacteraceae bacterium]